GWALNSFQVADQISFLLVLTLFSISCWLKSVAACWKLETTGSPPTQLTPKANTTIRHTTSTVRTTTPLARAWTREPRSTERLFVRCPIGSSIRAKNSSWHNDARMPPREFEKISATHKHAATSSSTNTRRYRPISPAISPRFNPRHISIKNAKWLRLTNWAKLRSITVNPGRKKPEPC